MSKKRKLTAKEDLVVEKLPASEEVTYSTFFSICTSKGLVDIWQENEIKAFFYSLGLKDKEPLNKYQDALHKY
jgi:hypothetical protein